MKNMPIFGFSDLLKALVGFDDVYFGLSANNEFIKIPLKKIPKCLGNPLVYTN